MPAIYVSDAIHAEALKKLSALGTVYQGYGEHAVAYESVSEQIDAVMLRAEIFDAEKIEASPKLKVIARHGVGTDNVDIEAATRAGIWVTSTPGSNSRAVAEHVFALLLSLARRTPYGVQAVSQGSWSEAKPHMLGFELHGKSLGLLGYGSISRMVHAIATGFGMKVLVHDPFVSDSDIRAAGAGPADFDTLIAQSDVLSLHLPLTDSTAEIISTQALAHMKQGAILVNTSRGGLVNEQALLEALENGHLHGAALDVLQSESVDMKNPLPHSVLAAAGLPNLILTPHVAGQSAEAFLAAGIQAFESIDSALRGKAPSAALNLVSLV
ncbi:hydroxyacid dehydrogenase [Glutamicibacter sp. NPDC087661]|uniref:hydroxyacid dehydrogenase n=1 Tax=unclassified Glutamicibacter TaxID=2627139 RepID=UPI000FB96C5C